jgi:subfamily B ATP-binding cassette protein MsbA
MAPGASNRELYFRLLAYVKPYWKAFALAVLGMVATAATEPVFPALMKHLLDSGFQTQDPRLIWAIPSGIVVLFVVRGILSFCTAYLMTWVSIHLVTDLRKQMFAKIVKLPTQAFHDQSAGKFISRILQDADNVNQAATHVLVTAIRESLTVVALLAYLLYLDWKLTLITFTIAPVIALILNAFSKRIRAASRMSFEGLRTMSHTIEETTSANKIVKIFGGQTHMLQRFSANLQAFRRSMMREALPAAAITPITHMTASIAIAIITFLALSQTTGQGSTTAGGFVSFITAMLLLISPIKQLTAINPIMQRGLAACESVFYLLDQTEETDTGQEPLTSCAGAIEFDHVSFQYPGSERIALDGLSFNAVAGQTIALVGASGGGKSTIAALVPRFYNPASGIIRIDGHDIKNLSLTSLRQHIAMVNQDVVLFNDTVAANIGFGLSHPVSEADIISAAKAAHAWEFIQQLPQGLQTMIGEDGAKLSGGQRQRIAIARALLKNAPILILDEATSALDTESERQVQAALSNLMRNRTTLVIAHRLSTIEHADQILVLDQGRIVERGSHHELLAKHGYYANLHHMQS